MGRLYITNSIRYIISLFLQGENILGNRYDILSPYFAYKLKLAKGFLSNLFAFNKYYI